MMSFYFAGESDYPYSDISDVSTKSQSRNRVGTFTTATTRSAWAVALVALVVFSTFFSTMASSGGAERANAEVQFAAEDVCDNVEEEFFPSVPVIPYVGPKGDLGKNKFAFRYYNADEEIAGKPMKEWLRFAVAFWHTFRGDGSDPFGAPTKSWPWDEAPRNSASGECSADSQTTEMAKARRRMRANFELMHKLSIERWCFHDRDIAPEGATLAETNANLEAIADYAADLQRGTNIRPLWGTAQLFKHPVYMSGAATSPNVGAFVRAAAQVKKAMDVTRRLGGENFNFWGGREGYQTLLTTNLTTERSHAARFFHMAADYWHNNNNNNNNDKAGGGGGGGMLLIEPKPQEPMKHQYDWDVATTAHFLSEHGLDARGFKLNIECNHAQLAGHSCDHEVAAAAALGLLGGLDANTGDPQVGWDTDQFLVDHAEAARVMLPVVRAGGFASPGGINFDAKLRRESVDVEDIVHAHVGSMDAMARGLRAAHSLAARGSELGAHIEEKYASWTSRLGRSIESGGETLQSLEALAMKAEEAGAAAGPTAARGDDLTRDDLSAAPSARQEAVENIFSRAVASVE